MPLYEPDVPSRTIGVEEHFGTQAVLRGGARRMVEAEGFATTVAELLEVGAGRIEAMDRAGMDMQVLSLTAPGIEPLAPEEAVEAARAANEHLEATVRAWPERLAGLAALPMSAPEAAAEELERTIAEGFVGAVINGHSQGRYLDHPMFEPVLATAERLSVPFYLHPTPPPEPVISAHYAGEFPPEAAYRLAGAGWGWHHETGTHALRLILGGVFDRFPGLQIMLGHHGETIPLLLPRIERNLPQRVTGLARPVRAYLRENSFYTFGGWNWMSMFEAVRRLVGPDRILFSTDYPFGSMEEAHSFLGHIEVSGEERELIAHGNAERLLKIPAARNETAQPAPAPCNAAP